MIRHVWSVACTKASIDNETNNVSLFEVLEQLQLAQWPERPAGGGVVAAAFPFEVVSLWIRSPIDEPARGECRLRITTPGRAVHDSPAQVMDLATFRRFRSRFQMPGLPIDGPGLCEIEVQFRPGADAEWQTAARVPIEIRLLDPPAAAT